MKLQPLHLAVLTCSTLACLGSSRLFAQSDNPLEICIDYHCKHRSIVTPTVEEWATILKPFARPADTPGMERQQIKRSIAYFEQVVGRHTPTADDLLRNQGEDIPGQLDCIAESNNPRVYLQALFNKRQLRWHAPGQRVKRSTWIFNVHWAASLVEKAGGAQHVIDSWYGSNGQEPLIQPLQQWLNR